MDDGPPSTTPSDSGSDVEDAEEPESRSLTSDGTFPVQRYWKDHWQPRRSRYRYAHPPEYPLVGKENIGAYMVINHAELMDS